MRDDRFEWDDRKARSNAAKHGVTFAEARKVFGDPYAVDDIDDDPGEQRDVAIGRSGDEILFVCWTGRNGRVRIISARKADRDEQDCYYRQAPAGE